ncbi:hypothetical protein MNBD_UNCLBAC01-205 [hydrothermal vent metagenome]|uniref:PIN domain-containing protein n=1 Tax=hydrothermal vent metagenome TaxID=652676 RepID=A0A3B1CYL7_9ZZZZ
MPTPPYRIFFDTSVYIAALLSPEGAAGELIRLAESGVIQMVVSQRVIIESDQVLKNKFSNLIEDSRRLWKSLSPELIKEPTSLKSKFFIEILPLSDALILSAAHKAGVLAFVTWNTRDFMKKGVESLVMFPIVVPGDCLKLFRGWIIPFWD